MQEEYYNSEDEPEEEIMTDTINSEYWIISRLSGLETYVRLIKLDLCTENIYFLPIDSL